MSEDFLLPVTHNGKELSLPVQLVRAGYIYRLQVEVNDTIVLFERDEERNWRAMVQDPGKDEKLLSPALVASIAEAIQVSFEE